MLVWSPTEGEIREVSEAMDASELREAGWERMRERPPMWRLRPLSYYEWWTKEDAVRIEHIRGKYGLPNIALVRVLIQAGHVCQILDRSEEEIDPLISDEEKDHLVGLHSAQVDLEAAIGITGDGG